jgi:hypothetical protein
MTITVVMIIMVDEKVKVGIGEGPVFHLASLSITVLLGRGKIGLPPTPSKLQYPQHRCLYQLPELEFRFFKAKHCWGQGGGIPQACPTPAAVTQPLL